MSANSSATRVDRTASALADLSLAGESGRFLGSEDELLLRFGVSRPTLRQAAKMVANDRLITVRRGTGGGVCWANANGVTIKVASNACGNTFIFE